MTIKTKTCPTLSDWHAFAASHGAPLSFFAAPTGGGRTAAEQSVSVSVMTSGAQTVALAPVFLASFEVGLWVDPDWRRQGAGATLLRHAVSQASPKSALIATVSTSNPSGPYMCRILHQCGFAPFAEAPDIRIWRKPA